MERIEQALKRNKPNPLVKPKSLYKEEELKNKEDSGSEKLKNI